MEDIVSQHVVKAPGICGGKACIAGSRIRVMDIVVWHELRGKTADELVVMFPGISLSDVYAALAYYFDHREEVDQDFQKDEATIKELLANQPSKAKRQA